MVSWCPKVVILRSNCLGLEPYGRFPSIPRYSNIIRFDLNTFKTFKYLILFTSSTVPAPINGAASKVIL